VNEEFLRRLLSSGFKNSEQIKFTALLAMHH